MTDFHDHLDVCKQCADNPFELCAVGAHLLASSVADAPLGFGRVIRTRAPQPAAPRSVEQKPQEQ